MDPFDPLLILAGFTLAAALAIGFTLARGLLSLPALHKAGRSETEPTVTVVVAARDEAASIAATIHALLAQDYPALDIVAVDDRSTDGTGEILDRFGEDSRVQVLHVDALPSGWLGKNHALQRGAEAAGGELLLFTDADVIMAPAAVSRAVALMQREGADHLAVAPRIRVGSAPARMTVAVFLVLFSTVFRPWKARDPDSRHYIGIGAFNLLRAEAYHAIDGHRTLALRPDDDVRLGRALKRAGFRQATAVGTRMVEVEWYPTLRAMARGLRKNAFAVAEYRLSVVAAGTLLPVVTIFWPLAALFVTEGVVWWLNAGVIAVGVFTTFATSRAHRLPAWVALTYPLASVFLVWIIWSSALRAVLSGAIEWRGTRYPLDELRR